MTSQKSVQSKRAIDDDTVISDITNTLIVYASGSFGAKKESLEIVQGTLEAMMKSNPYLCDSDYLIENNTEHWIMSPLSISKKRVKYRIEQFKHIIHSTNTNLQHARLIGKTIHQNYGQYDSFIVIAGLDTICYVSSLVSFMFENLDKMILFTGGSIPLSYMRNDSFNNLISALSVTSEFRLPQVLVLNKFSVFRGNRASKIYQGRFDTIQSPNFPPLIQIKIDLVLNEKLVLRKPLQKMTYFDEISDQIKILKYHPLLHKRTLEYQIQDPTVKAIIIESYASANLPEDQQILLLFKKAYEQKNIIFLNISQCTYYPNNSSMKEILAAHHILYGGNMTTQASIAKLAYLIGRGFKTHEIAAQISRNMRGELTQIELHQEQFQRNPQTFMELVESALPRDIKKNNLVIRNIIEPTVVKELCVKATKKQFLEYMEIDDKVEEHIFKIPDILVLAAKYGNYELVRFFLEKGVNCNQIMNNISALYYALKKEDKKITHELIKRGGEVIASKQDIWELFEDKIKADRVEFLRLCHFTNLKDRLNEIKNEDQQGLGHLCVYLEAKECLKYLRQKEVGYDLWMRDIYGNTVADEVTRLQSK